MSKIGFGQNGLEEYAGQGHWNDPDMLVVGKVGWGPDLHKTRLTPDEQVTHMTLWSILAAPLLLGNDMADMDAFTKDLLKNHEVLEVNQDPLGEQGARRAKNGKTEVWSRPLWDGTMAVGLFNRGEDEKEVVAKWQDLGISGKQPVRDLWRHKDLGSFAGSFSAKVPAHGAMLLKVGKPKRKDFNLKQYIKEHPEEAGKWM
jgi:alpha-galactosidase